MADDIERCAVIADEAVQELKGMLTTARKTRYDRQGPAQVQYAIRWVEKLAKRIRAIGPPAVVTDATASVELGAAKALLRELRPVIANTAASQWRGTTLQKIDDML